MYRRAKGVGVLQTASDADRRSGRDESQEELDDEPLTFEDIVTNCFRFLGINDVEKILDMTPGEYTALMRGYSLKQVDIRYQSHMQAWLNQMVKATKGSEKNPKPAFGEFKDFFDYEEEIKSVERLHRLKRITREKVNRFKRSKAEAERLINEGR
ncbi:tail assembly chaperone [Bacillus phage Mgbh1]|uniref:Uncharacterized protein n=1 Tax=Bacillus phage Mgbh1 TaxID=1796993 RepID=A0A142F1M9_9CAUD|nr:tail assembly chaperone [Bacillus phage Mgbh1]AMQ66686.1 hypothetical protein [Bacillus phage Mgbh1]